VHNFRASHVNTCWGAYKRNGTTTLFAALNALTGVVIRECLPRHRHREFLKFLRTIDREVIVPALPFFFKSREGWVRSNAWIWVFSSLAGWSNGLDTLGPSNSSTQPFTLPSEVIGDGAEATYTNGDVTGQAIRRGDFDSVPTLITAIQDYGEAPNEEPKPFEWTATAEAILVKVNRGRIHIAQAHIKIWNHL
jgi:hypothetical protein